MGMAASQVRLCSLTARKHNNGYELQMIATQLQSLNRDMSKLTNNYRQSLTQKSLKWTNDSGLNYIDISYSTLMRPSTTNRETPFLITNLNNRIIVDSRYKRYAEMISPDGEPGGDWESVRSQILSELLEIDESELEEFVTLEDTVKGLEYQLNSYPEGSAEWESFHDNEYLPAVNAWETHFLYTQEKQIKFYDYMFSAIADCGWTYDEDIGDSERLNQMLQNGSYTITRVEREYGRYGYMNKFDTNLASNCNNIVAVNDTSVQESAKQKYEYEKGLIQRKEDALNIRQKNLETEAESIKNMIEQLKTTVKENSERATKIFTG